MGDLLKPGTMHTPSKVLMLLWGELVILDVQSMQLCTMLSLPVLKHTCA